MQLMSLTRLSIITNCCYNMIGLVMAGGKGTRMVSKDEKLLLKYIHPTILHVIFALQKSQCFSKIIAATSPNSPRTKDNA